MEIYIGEVLNSNNNKDKVAKETTFSAYKKRMGRFRDAIEALEYEEEDGEEDASSSEEEEEEESISVIFFIDFVSLLEGAKKSTLLNRP